MMEPIILTDPVAPIVPLTPAELHDMPIHFSTLKRFDRSPKHYEHAITSGKGKTTRDMRIGTIVHRIVCGEHRTRPLVRYEGGDERKGNDWKSFELRTLKAQPRAEIVTIPEWAEGERIAMAVLADPVARELLEGARREVSLSWENAGIRCATDGIDFVNDRLRLIGDLKMSRTTEPGEFSRHAARMLYHAQMAWMEDAAHSQPQPIATDGGVFLLGVEHEPPHVVTVLRLPPPVLEVGRRLCVSWMERLRLCRENAHWPGYVSGIVDMELPTWLADGEGEDGGDA